jgi:hypothetical protein
VALFGAQPPTFNRPFLATDAASLWIDATTDTYQVLGLVPGAIRLTADTQLSQVIVQEVTGGENLKLRIQGERDWLVAVKGYTYDYANGGANPSDAALATATNWDLVASSHKLGAGILINVQ